MQAPEFWTRSPDTFDIRRAALSPLGALYGAVTARRVARAPEVTPACPVFCVGNINVGGTGKTPTTIWLVERLRDFGHTPHVVTRGYGGRLKGPVAVDPTRHSADEVGDEPLLMAAFADVWVAKDRAQGARAAEAAGATAIVLDDGLQNPSVAKSFSLLVVDAEYGFGNEACLPAGPLREPVEAGLARVHAIVALGKDDATTAFQAAWANKTRLPIYTGSLQPLQTGMSWADTKVLAFAGIGNPGKFFKTLRDLGAELVRTEALDDHQALSKKLMTRLAADARSLGAQLVTTEKDAVRLPNAFRTKVITLPVRLSIADEELVQSIRRVAPPPP